MIFGENSEIQIRQGFPELLLEPAHLKIALKSMKKLHTKAKYGKNIPCWYFPIWKVSYRMKYQFSFF